MNLLGLSPLPILDLQDIAAPQDGIFTTVPETCKRNFKRDNRCRAHYEAIARSAGLQDRPVQCPFGFSSYGFRAGMGLYCLTAVIPYPRLGGDDERKMARTHSDNKVALDQITVVAAKLKQLDARLAAIAAEALDRQSMALHEVRKLNRNIKQEAERMCSEESADDPDLADPRLVKIWKSSELMSLQFDVIEILANEQLLALPVRQVSEIYRLFDKCVRIYRPREMPERIRMEPAAGFRAKILACDKTFHLIPTILIENALKYSIPESAIVVSFSRNRGNVEVAVRNDYVGATELTDEVFKKGVRATKSVKEGTGNGLYVASLVAQQHGARLAISTEPIGNYRMECVLTLTIAEHSDALAQ